MTSEDLDRKLIDIAIQIAKQVPFNRHKSEELERVLKETPEELSRMLKNFNEAGLQKVISTENDFLLGTVISFIYYKFLVYCSYGGWETHVKDEELPLFLSSLFSNTEHLMNLIITITGK
jgi:hypothetical protein